RHTRLVSDWSSDVCSSDLRFADARFTARQNEQARRDGASGIYTPQVVLDGRSWSGWYRGASLPAPAVATAAMRVVLAANDRVDRSEERRVGKGGRSRGARE